MDQIGFTFYPRDWWTSDHFINLENAEERYVYLECLFLMYSDPKGVKNDRDFMAKRLRISISKTAWENAIKSFNRVGDYLQSDTVKKRRTRAEAARINGQNGGRPSGQNAKPKNPDLQTQAKPVENRKNPPYKEKEKDKRNRNITETPVKGVEGYMGSNGSNHNPPSPTPRPLYGAGLRDGLIVQEVWGEYGKHLRKNLAVLTRERMLKAWLFYWPFELKGQELERFKTEVEKLSDKGLKSGLAEIAMYLLDVGQDGPTKAAASVEIFSDPLDIIVNNSIV